MLQIKLGPSLFIPNSQIGTFGAVTQFKSLVKNNTDMFDVSFSGPAAAAVTALALFVAGLVLSAGGDIPKASFLCNAPCDRHAMILKHTMGCCSSC